eukprot:scaffold21197_cov127-Isochrysis_galbana.AAC.4
MDSGDPVEPPLACRAFLLKIFFLIDIDTLPVITARMQPPAPPTLCRFTHLNQDTLSSHGHGATPGDAGSPPGTTLSLSSFLRTNTHYQHDCDDDPY